MTPKYRACIIGGGIVGASVLYHLAKLGWTECVLLERDDLTAGATWHAAGNGGAWGGSVLLTRIQKYSIELYKKLEAEGRPTGMHQPGSITVSRNSDRIFEFHRQAGIAKSLGLDFAVLTPTECKSRVPLMNVDDIVAGIWDPLHSHFDPSSVTNAMAQGARELGAHIKRQSKVVGLERRKSSGWIIKTAHDSIEADVVINCAGMWAPEVAQLAGRDLPIVPILHQYVVTEPVSEIEALSSELPIIRDREGSFYLRQERQGLLVGPYEKNPVVWNPNGIPPEFGRELLPENLEQIEMGMLAAIYRLPCLGHAGIVRVVNGPIPYTPDERPLIGQMSGLRGMWLCTGTGLGILQGGGMGKFVAEWIVEGETEWDPTAIHPGRFGDFATKQYTIGKAIESYADHYEQIAYPGFESSVHRQLRTSPLYDLHKADGAVFGALNGWERPVWFAPAGVDPVDSWAFKRPASFKYVGEEHMACRQSVAMFDLTTFAKYEVTGPNARDAVNHLFTGKAPKQGRALVTFMCSPKGGIIGDFTIACIDENTFYLVGAGSTEEIHLDWMQRNLKAGSTLTRVSTQRGVLHIAGPNSRKLLADLTPQDVSNEAFPFLAVRDLVLGVCKARTIRVSFSGDLGYEIHVPTEYQRALYNLIKLKGQAYNLRLAGSRALSTLRLEKGFLLSGLDLNTEFNPFHTGLDFMVNFNKPDFIGRDALAKLQNSKRRYREILVEVDASDADCVGGEAIFQGSELIGQITSGGYGHWARKSLAVAWLKAEYTERGAEMDILLYGQKHRARVMDQPPFDPDNTRIRG